MLQPRSGKLSLEVLGDVAIFHRDSLRQKRSSAACLGDLTGLFYYLQLFAWLGWQTLRPKGVFLAHLQREDVMPFLGLFDAPVAVGKATYGFSFDADLLARRPRLDRAYAPAARRTPRARSARSGCRRAGPCWPRTGCSGCRG